MGDDGISYVFVDLGSRSFDVNGYGLLLDVDLLEAFLDMAVFLVLYLAFVLDLMLLRARFLSIWSRIYLR